ncbi:hypothetical protein E4N71_11140 [Treponema vincentii]|uniref:hypothetical protein n=1 Tax=Treponema vincentii TaxID=69710 RepID=UPI003D8D5840
MKKVQVLFLLLMTMVTLTSLYAEQINVSEYFPTAIASSWTYADANGKESMTVSVKNSALDKNDGTSLYLFEEKIKGIGTTATLYSIKKNTVLILVSKNILGKYIEYQEPYPVTLASPDSEGQYIESGDNYFYKTSRASCKFDNKEFTDCILIEERLTIDKNIIRIKKSYYAKNIGLVYVTLIDNAGKETVYNKLVESSLLNTFASSYKETKGKSGGKLQLSNLVDKWWDAEYFTLKYSLLLQKDNSFIVVASGEYIDGMATGTYTINDDILSFSTLSYRGKNVNLIFRQYESYKIESMTADSFRLENINPPDDLFGTPLTFKRKD